MKLRIPYGTAVVIPYKHIWENPKINFRKISRKISWYCRKNSCTNLERSSWWNLGKTYCRKPTTNSWINPGRNEQIYGNSGKISWTNLRMDFWINPKGNIWRVIGWLHSYVLLHLENVCHKILEESGKKSYKELMIILEENPGVIPEGRVLEMRNPHKEISQKELIRKSLKDFLLD